MITPALGGLLIGFMLILVATVSKDEKWSTAYGIVGMIFIFWCLGFFNIGGRLVGSLIPALTMLFALFSFHTKGNSQLLSIIVTLVLLFQLVS